MPEDIAGISEYKNAKVVIVGDTGVGKSGLSLVLAMESWEATASTHGRRVWTLNKTESVGENGRQEIREIVLWDLAGQPNYRLINPLYLSETSVAIVVFDSRSELDPFSGVRYWDRALRQAQRASGDSPPLRKFLVAARVDVGRIGVSFSRIKSLIEELGFDEYFETSAKEGWGIAELRDAIHQRIDWQVLPSIISSKLFKDIMSFLVSEKEAGRLLSTSADLYRGYLLNHKITDATDDARAMFDTCIGRTESRGLVQRLSFGGLVLLQPELRDAYAAAIIDAAEDDPDGLGSIYEETARTGRFRIPETERTLDKEQERLLLVATVEEILRYEIAFREQGEDGSYLVFPSQLTRENNDLIDPEGKSIVYTFEGSTLNIYSTLVVRLAHSTVFKKRELWKNAAVYTAAVGGTCGIALRETDDGRGELTLFFDTAASEETRFHFDEFVQAHLRRRALPDSVLRRRLYACPSCGTPITELQAQRRRERGFDWLACSVCGARISLLDRGERLLGPSPSVLTEMERAADSRREDERAASSLQGKIATSDYDVFLCHNSADKPAVREIAEELKRRGILPWLDEWELRPGSSWQESLEQRLRNIKSVAVFIGKNGLGPWHDLEVRGFLRQFAARQTPIIPVILGGVQEVPNLPVFLEGLSWVDFRQPQTEPLEKLIWGITGERRVTAT